MRISVPGVRVGLKRMPGAISQPWSIIAGASRSVSTPTSTQPNRPAGVAAKRQPASSASRTQR